MAWIPLDDAAFGLHEKQMILVAGGADGLLRIWRTSTTGTLIGTLAGALGHLESVRALCQDQGCQHLIMSDSSGHIKIWATGDLHTSDHEALVSSFRMVRSAIAVADACMLSVSPFAQHRCCDALRSSLCQSGGEKPSNLTSPC